MDTPTMAPAVEQSTTFELTPQQVAFYRTFGFVKLPGLFAAEIERIDRGFEEVFAADVERMEFEASNSYHHVRDAELSSLPRVIIPRFIDQSDDLRWLRDDPRTVGIVRSLLGTDTAYNESDGNLMNCEVFWHIDSYGSPVTIDHLKLYFYLDHLTADSGALRVIPGSEDLSSPYAQQLHRYLTHPETVPDTLGVALDEIPAHVLEVEPGDVIAGNFRTLHASFRGSPRRRLFTVNFKKTA